VYYRSIFDAVRDLLHDEAFDHHDRVMSRYLKPDLLILDDMGIKARPNARVKSCSTSLCAGTSCGAR